MYIRDLCAHSTKEREREKKEKKKKTKKPHDVSQHRPSQKKRANENEAFLTTAHARFHIFLSLRKRQNLARLLCQKNPLYLHISLGSRKHAPTPEIRKHPQPTKKERTKKEKGGKKKKKKGKRQIKEPHDASHPGTKETSK